MTMSNDREMSIQTEATALADCLLGEHGTASLHLARLVQADLGHSCLSWFAEAMAEALRGWETNTRYLEGSDIYRLMQAAARRLVEVSDNRRLSL